MVLLCKIVSFLACTRLGDVIMESALHVTSMGHCRNQMSNLCQALLRSTPPQSPHDLFTIACYRYLRGHVSLDCKSPEPVYWFQLTNLCLTLLFTTACYLRGHVALDCKSPEPVCCGAGETLGMLVVPVRTVFPDKVFRTESSS